VVYGIGEVFNSFLCPPSSFFVARLESGSRAVTLLVASRRCGARDRNGRAERWGRRAQGGYRSGFDLGHQGPGTGADLLLLQRRAGGGVQRLRQPLQQVAGELPRHQGQRARRRARLHPGVQPGGRRFARSLHLGQDHRLPRGRARARRDGRRARLALLLVARAGGGLAALPGGARPPGPPRAVRPRLLLDPPRQQRRHDRPAVGETGEIISLLSQGISSYPD